MIGQRASSAERALGDLNRIVRAASVGCLQRDGRAGQPEVLRRAQLFTGALVTAARAQRLRRQGQLGPRVSGVIDKIFVRVGDRVKANDPLFQTRDIEIRLRVSELENQVKLAQAELHNVDLAFKRVEELHKKGYASNGKLDDARAARDTASARLGIAQAQLAAAKQQLSDCTVRAPFDGVITRRDVDEGKFMVTMGGFEGGQREGGGGGGGGVLQIMKIDIVAAIVQIPEVELSKIHVGTKGKVFVDGVGRAYDSYAIIINDAINSTTRAVEVRLTGTGRAPLTMLFLTAPAVPPPVVPAAAP